MTHSIPGAHAKLGGIRTFRADGSSAPHGAPPCPPLPAPLLQRQSRGGRRDRRGRRRRRSGLDRRLSVLLLPELRFLLRPRALSVLRRAPYAAVTSGGLRAATARSPPSRLALPPRSKRQEGERPGA